MLIEYFDNITETFDKIIGDINFYESLTKIIDLLKTAKQNNKFIYMFGNGGSAANASHFANDLQKMAGFKVNCLNDNIPLMLAYANDLGYFTIFAKQLKTLIEKDDVVIGFSGSGNSLNVIQGLLLGNQKKAITIALTGFDGGMIKNTAQHSLIVPSNNMGQIESIHLIIIHLIAEYFKT